MTVSRIIVGLVTYNSLLHLPRCLDALHHQTTPPDAVVIFDNASTDGSPAWLRTQATDAVCIFNPANIGFGRAHNRIIQQMALREDDYYLTLNPDVELAPGFITNLRAVFDHHPGAGWASGKLLYPDGRIYCAGHALLRDGYGICIGHRLPDGPFYNHPREVFGAPGTAAMYRGACLLAVQQGGAVFDEAMFLYSEDIDLDWRARRAGWRCYYEPGAAAVHHKGHNPNPFAVDAVVNRYLAVIKNADWVTFWLFNLPTIGLHILLRTLVTPRQGVYMAARLLQLWRGAWRQRIRSQIPARDMRAWFRWSQQQPTGQPRSYGARMRAFLRGRRQASFGDSPAASSAASPPEGS